MVIVLLFIGDPPKKSECKAYQWVSNQMCYIPHATYLNVAISDF